MIAARVAADFEHDPDVEVQTKKGGLGELSVDVDGRRAFTGSRLWYPAPTAIIKKVRVLLFERPETLHET
jgi:hypothetical protein